jgi:predicted nucleotide-binding protein
VNHPRYHVYIEYEDPEKSGIRFNVAEEELVRTFVIPFRAGQPFWFMGRLLSPLKVVKVVIFWSYENADKLVLPNQETIATCKNKKFVIDNISKGKVKGAYLYTEKFLTPTDKKTDASSLPSTNDASVASVNMRRIVVVHGSDEEMKQATVGALGKLGLAPVLMREQPSQGKKIVEKFLDYADVSFAVVLLSPDDFAYAKDQSPTKRKLRPAQDVIFELGFFLGRLGKDNVLVFYREFENFEVPTNFEGIRFTAFDDRGSWKLSLIRELTACGYSVDANKLLK